MHVEEWFAPQYSGADLTRNSRMASSLPIVRQVAWLSVVPQLTVMAALIAVAHGFEVDNPILVGSLAYLVLSFTLRRVIPAHHRAGLKLFRKERFAEAIPRFERSYEFFAKHRWLDRWRFLTLLSSSRISYREMALLNLAFCLAQSGQRDRALAEYQRALAEFPDSKVAQMAIRMLDGGTAGELRA
jgi:tetratricopeptide (TPR) repeat protein